jgi:hypothetical protein
MMKGLCIARTVTVIEELGRRMTEALRRYTCQSMLYMTNSCFLHISWDGVEDK